MRILILNLLLICILFSCKRGNEQNIETNFTSTIVVEQPENNLGKRSDKMINKNEEVIYSFETKNNKQLIIVKDTSNKYIQYRFGTDNNIEMEYPIKTTIESWNKFQYNSYWRGGGKENAGMEIDNLQFINNGYTYLIYRTYFAEKEENSAGIIVLDSTNRETRIKGIPATIKGCICNIEETGLIEKIDIGLTF